MKREKKAKPHIRFYLVLLMFCLETLAFIGLIIGIIVLPLYKYLWIVVFITILLNIICSIFIANTNVESGFKISWLVVINFVPIGGIILYILYADKITTKRMVKLRFNKINSELDKGLVECSNTLNEIKNIDENAYRVFNYVYLNGHSSAYKNSSMEYYTLGDYAFEPILEALKKAKRFIFMEYFIIDHGIFFDSIYEILKQKAKEGVDVRLIYDDFGSVFKVKAFFYKQAINDGIKCIAFNRCRPFMDIRQNNRDHRKILVIDGITSFSGGINIADEYINKVTRFGLWKDNCFKIDGEATNGLTNLFISNWNIAHKDKLEHKKYMFDANKDLVDYEIKSDGFMQPFGDVPFDNEETCHNATLQLINKAKKYIYISTPYLIPDEELLDALAIASKSGVNVKIITPGIPDKKLIYSATRSYYARLILNGIEIYEYTPGFNHLKCMVVDDEYCLTGTVNFDYRSFYLHFENDVLFYKNSKIPLIRDDLLEMISQSECINKSNRKDGFFKKIYRAFIKIFSPLY